jgi:putative endonuclease
MQILFRLIRLRLDCHVIASKAKQSIDKMKAYFVYILTNRSNNVLYTGMTNSLMRRVWEHKAKLIGGFTKQYKVDKLVYYESFDNPSDAITREKQIKAGSRNKKLELINNFNPGWKDLYNLEKIYK